MEEQDRVPQRLARAIVVLVMLGAGSASAQTLTPTDWDYKREVTFTDFSGKGSLTNFPLLVKFDTSDNFYDGFDSVDGDDLRFTAEDGETVLNYEIEKWNTSGESFVWVQVTNLSHNGSIWAYWGNSGASQPSYTTDGSTWSEGYTAVWHLDETAAKDSAANASDGTANGSVSTTSGLIGDALDFGGNPDSVQVANTGDMFGRSGTASITVSAWIKTSTDGSTWPRVMDTDQSSSWVLNVRDDNERINFSRKDVVGHVQGTAAVTDDAWTYVVGTYDGTNVRLYDDGVQEGITASSDSVGSGGANLMIGSNSGSGEYFQGLIDEARVSTVARSSNWVWACFRNQGANHSSFVSYGSIERTAVPAGIFVIR